MNNIVKKEGINLLPEVLKSADTKFTLEQWPCTVAILGICATYAFVSWLNRPVHDVENKVTYTFVFYGNENYI